MRRPVLAGIAMALAIGILATSCKEDGVLVTVDTTVRHQTMEGFGASGSWTIDPVGEHWSEEQRRELARLLFSSPYAWRKADTIALELPPASVTTFVSGEE